MVAYDLAAFRGQVLRPWKVRAKLMTAGQVSWMESVVLGGCAKVDCTSSALSRVVVSTALGAGGSWSSTSPNRSSK